MRDAKEFLSQNRVALAVACLVIAPSLFVWRFYSNRHEGRYDLSGGAVIQRKRIDTFIKNTAKLDYEGAISALSKSSEDFNVAYLAGLTADFSPPVVMRQVLADRRVAKIYEELAGLSPEDASRKATEAFDVKLENHEREYAKWCDGTSGLKALPSYPHHAAAATLFLCTSFCGKDKLLEKFDKWHSQLGKPQYEGGGFSSHLRYPDPLFTMNLFFLAAEKQGLTLQDLNTKLSALESRTGESFPRSQKLKFFKWSAHTNDTDFTHITRGVPFDGREILTEVTGFANWPSPNFGRDPKVTKFVLDEVRSWLK